MGLLLLLVLLLVLGYLAAGPGDNLAGVLLVLAGLIAVPLLISLLLWVTGNALRRQTPGPALFFVVASTVAGGLGVLLVAAWFLPSLGG